MEKGYDTLVDALNDLREEGFSEDFNLSSNCIVCTSKDNIEVLPEDFNIVAYYRFEGDSNPDDSSVLYAIDSPKHEIKGIMVDAYGAYSDPLSIEMLQKLKIKR